jgi:hypothetical protein
MSHTALQEAVLYAAFLAGMALFILKRAAGAIRSKVNPISSRRQYLLINWDLLLIRAGLELPLYWIFSHYDLSTILKYVGLAWEFPFKVPVNPITAFIVGYQADSMLDWISLWKKAPDFIRENIPQVNNSEKNGGNNAT